MYGFRGATTRRIAEAAGVNEVTLFRHFGSKEALLNEAMRALPTENNARLPADPRDPEIELTAWCEVHQLHLRSKRSMIRTCMGEIEERPEMTECAAEGPRKAFDDLSQYLRRVRETGLSLHEFDERVAAIMLMGAMFSDAMGREMMPEIYPSTETAPAQYAAMILRAIGADEASRARLADATGAR